MTFDAKNVASAIETLQAELQHALDDSDGLDQKALAIPAYTTALAAFFLAPLATNAKPIQIALAAISIAAAAMTLVAGFVAQRPARTYLGPDADELINGLPLPPDAFQVNVLGSLHASVKEQVKANHIKSGRLWTAIRLALITTTLVIATRLAGGI